MMRWHLTASWLNLQVVSYFKMMALIVTEKNTIAQRQRSHGNVMEITAAAVEQDTGLAILPCNAIEVL